MVWPRKPDPMVRRAFSSLALDRAARVGADAHEGTVFCCMDNGHQVCGDVLPMQCWQGATAR